MFQKALLIELEQADHSDYWLGLNNFYVITRYNRSPLYSMAVYQFSQQLKEQHASKNNLFTACRLGYVSLPLRRVLQAQTTPARKTWTRTRAVIR